MNGYGYGLESDELFENDESDEAYDESSDEAVRKGRPARINPGRTGRGTGLFRPRPTNNNKYVTQAQLEAGLARVGKQISANSDAIKKVATQANKINSELGEATTKLNKQVGDLKKEVKQQAETNLLLTLLNKPPAIKPTTQTVSGTNAAGQPVTVDVVTKVEYEKQSNLLPLVLLTSQGGLGGGSGDSSNMLFLALALSGQL
ncbi:MAG: hypothetical protein QOF89_4855 [Acidobacteriota bacterium]|jgi:hypothetical protein|nr:hypothetical protein [Acidobacteriota bacterium]